MPRLSELLGKPVGLRVGLPPAPVWPTAARRTRLTPAFGLFPQVKLVDDCIGEPVESAVKAMNNGDVSAGPAPNLDKGPKSR